MDEAPQPFPLTVEELVRAGGISPTYAHNIVKGHRSPGDALAIRIWRDTGIKLAGIANAADSDIEALERVLASRPRSEVGVGG